MCDCELRYDSNKGEDIYCGDEHEGESSRILGTVDSCVLLRTTYHDVRWARAPHPGEASDCKLLDGTGRIVVLQQRCIKHFRDKMEHDWVNVPIVREKACES